MPKIEISVSDHEKEQMQRAADANRLRLATWARAVLLLSAIDNTQNKDAK